MAFLDFIPWLGRKNNSDQKDDQNDENPSSPTSSIFLRVCEIYALYATGRSIEVPSEEKESLERVLKSGFLKALYEALFYVQDYSTSAYLLINISDGKPQSSPLSPPTGEEFWRVDFLKGISEQIHYTRYLEIHSWRGKAQTSALKNVCCNFDRGSRTLIEFLENKNKSYIKMGGGLSSITSFRSQTKEEIASYTSLIPKITDKNFLLLGSEDEVGNVDRSESASTVFPQLAGVLSAQSGIPMNFFQPEASIGANGYDLFYKEIELISDLIIKPVFNTLLERLDISINWQFGSLEPLNEKEKAEAELKKEEVKTKRISSLKDLFEMWEKASASLSEEEKERQREQWTSLLEKEIKNFS